MQINEEQLKKFILDSGLVSRSDFELSVKKAREKKQKIGNILLSDGKISETDLKRMEAFVLGIPFVNLTDKKSPARAGGEDGLEVAMLDVDDLSVIDFIKKRSGFKILPRLTDTASIKSVLTQYRKSLNVEFQNIIQKESNSFKNSSTTENETRPTEQSFGRETAAKSELELKAIAEDLPIVKIVDSLIFHAILQNASDIHIEPGEKELTIRYRI